MPSATIHTDTIYVAIETVSLGHALIAHTDLGVRAILLGDDVPALRRDLQKRFSNATIVESEPRHRELIDQVTVAIEFPEKRVAIPLDARGTPFQQTVWQALREIPTGSTVSYTDLAIQLGRPKSARAVAQACAANAVAVIIPCHRVVRSDGTLSGYRWGVQRKRRLLEQERDIISTFW